MIRPIDLLLLPASSEARGSGGGFNNGTTTLPLLQHIPDVSSLHNAHT